MKLHFNDPAHNEERVNTEPLTLKEEMEVTRILDNAMFYSDHSAEDYQKIQRFLNHYQNLCHHAAVTNMQQK